MVYQHNIYQHMPNANKLENKIEYNTVSAILHIKEERKQRWWRRAKQNALLTRSIFTTSYEKSTSSFIKSGVGSWDATDGDKHTEHNHGESQDRYNAPKSSMHCKNILDIKCKYLSKVLQRLYDVDVLNVFQNYFHSTLLKSSMFLEFVIFWYDSGLKRNTLPWLMCVQL